MTCPFLQRVAVTASNHLNQMPFFVVDSVAFSMEFVVRYPNTTITAHGREDGVSS
jgi:hypothetical protein